MIRPKTVDFLILADEETKEFFDDIYRETLLDFFQQLILEHLEIDKSQFTFIFPDHQNMSYHCHSSI